MPLGTNLLRDSRSPLVSDADLIKPRKVALGGTSEPRTKFDFRPIWILAAVLSVALLLFTLILLAPEQPLPTSPPEAPLATKATPQPASASAPTPLEMARKKRALEEANALVKRFTELEIELEDTWNADLWGEEGLSQARMAAADAETAFADSEYETALLGYNQGLTLLEDLREQAKSEYETAVGKAIEALNRRDGEAAEAALIAAARYQPESAMVEAGQRRLERLPELISLLERAELADSRGDTEEAIKLMEAARVLDPGTEGIGERLANLRQTRRDTHFRRTLAEGYEALNSQDYAAAEQAFTAALGMKPKDPGALQGLEQTRLTRTNLTITTLLTEARSLAQQENWQAAAQAFARVLEVDANLSEANTGLDQARARQELDEILSALIADPGQLADERLFVRARTLLQRVEGIEPRGARIEQQIKKLAEQIDYASRPTQLTLVSDGKTDVRIQYHGELGRFTTRALSTRPGRYLIRGGRDGFREVRFEVTLAPGPQRLEVICSEPIN